MGAVSIRPASAGDLPLLGVVGPAAYAAAYHHLWDDSAALARHLETFGEAGLRRFLAQDGARLWLAEQEGMPVGFLTLLLDSPDPIEGRDGGVEIPRIFLLPSMRGQGVGRGLFEPARDEASRAGARYLWLDAMDGATWAIGAYLKWGFERIGTSRFPGGVAAEHSGMVVLRMQLPDAPGG